MGPRDVPSSRRPSHSHEFQGEESFQLSPGTVQSVAQALSIAVNDPLAPTWEIASPSSKRRCAQQALRLAAVFDSSVIPPIGIDRYLMRLSATFRCSEATFIVALIVVDRLLEYDGGRLPLTDRNVHRLFLASLVVSVKFHEDLVYSNAHYAKAGGVHLKEVNRLERVLLMALDFDLRVSPEQFRAYEACLTALRPSDSSPEVAEAVAKREQAVCRPDHDFRTDVSGSKCTPRRKPGRKSAPHSSWRARQHQHAW